jgi:fluoride ion exporter CrcB/FEX
LYPQILGCFLLGFIIPLRKAYRRKSMELICDGVSVGLCGSLTTFSSFSLELFAWYAFFSEGSNGFRFLNAVSVVISTIGMGYASLVFGMQITSYWEGKRLSGHNHQLEEEVAIDDDIADTCTHMGLLDGIVSKLLCNLIILLYVVSLVVAVCLFAMMEQLDQNAWQWIWSLIFAPLGSLCRFHLAKLLNKRRPFGTFVANFLGSLFLSLCFLSLHFIDANVYAAIILNAVIQGFCGCLTTLSTFIAEIKSMKFDAAFIYAVSSIIACQIAMLPVIPEYL